MKHVRLLLETGYASMETQAFGFISPPGVGKTQMVNEHSLRMTGKPAKVFHAPQMQPQELSGMAMPDIERKVMHYLDNSLLKDLEEGDVLDFEEVLNAHPMVLNALLTLIQDRTTVSGFRLPPVQIVCTGNPKSPDEYSPAFRQRFTWHQVIFDEVMWTEFIRAKHNVRYKTNVSQHIKRMLNEYAGKWNVLSPREADKITAVFVKEPSLELMQLYRNVVYADPILEEMFKQCSKKNEKSLEETMVTEIVDDFIQIAAALSHDFIDSPIRHDDEVIGSGKRELVIRPLSDTLSVSEYNDLINLPLRKKLEWLFESRFGDELKERLKVDIVDNEPPF